VLFSVRCYGPSFVDRMDQHWNNCYRALSGPGYFSVFKEHSQRIIDKLLLFVLRVCLYLFIFDGVLRFVNNRTNFHEISCCGVVLKFVDISLYLKSCDKK
jgi:hypothetical protein